MSVAIDCGHWNVSKRGHTLGRHRNSGLELVLIMNGAATWDYDGRLVHVPARHVSFTWPWEWHRALDDYLPSSDVYWIILPLAKCPEKPTPGVRLHSRLGLNKVENQSLISSLLKTRTPVLKASPQACRLFPEAVARLHSSGGRLDLGSRAMILAILAELQFSALAAPLITQAKPEARARARARVEAFLKQLQFECGDPWPLEKMAEACGMGRTHFTRWLKELTGDTPVQHLNRLRVERAKSLLATPGSSVTKIALDCGFCSSHYFATVFRNFTGLKPSSVSGTR